jgi:hypothetical protein
LVTVVECNEQRVDQADQYEWHGDDDCPNNPAFFRCEVAAVDERKKGRGTYCDVTDDVQDNAGFRSLSSIIPTAGRDTTGPAHDAKDESDCDTELGHTEVYRAEDYPRASVC